VTGLLALAENAVGASSYRPGDVVTCYGGRTVEILNTDAEGRMVLADALSYADATLDPELLVDVATLTGAASLGLGRRHAALYATDDRVAGALEAAGAEGGELVWRMPLVEEYRPVLDSPVADLRNVSGDASVGGGSITAASSCASSPEDVPGCTWTSPDGASRQGRVRGDPGRHRVRRAVAAALAGRVALMYGLTVRWSLGGTLEELPQRLRDYVVGESLAKFTGREGLRFKTWRMRPGEWFEGIYVFESAEARDGFQESFSARRRPRPERSSSAANR